MTARQMILMVFAVSLICAAGPANAVDSALMTYCKADIERLCAGVAPGGGRLIKCLKGHKEEMSVGCAQALMKLKKQSGK